MKDLKAVIVEGTNAWVLFDGEEEIAHGIIHQGEVTGEVKEISETLLLRVLSMLRPTWQQTERKEVVTLTLTNDQRLMRLKSLISKTAHDTRDELPVFLRDASVTIEQTTTTNASGDQS